VRVSVTRVSVVVKQSESRHVGAHSHTHTHSDSSREDATDHSVCQLSSLPRRLAEEQSAAALLRRFRGRSLPEKSERGEDEEERQRRPEPTPARR